jgi:hypothetical protein
LEQEPWSSEPAKTKRGHLFRHQLLLLVGILFGIAGVVAAYESPLACLVLFVLAGLAWIGSGVSAIAGKRHMFGRATGWSGNVKMTPSAVSRGGSAVVGGVFILAGLGLVSIGVRVLAPGGPARPWDPCEHVTCPGHFDCAKAGGGAPETRAAACKPLYGGASCGDAITATDPARLTCRGSPATMHCDLPKGGIDCPALWIEKDPVRSIYVTGCCGADDRGVFCGAPSVDAVTPTCERVTPGDQWAPAP